MNRRAFLKKTVPAILGYSLVRTLSTGKLLAGPVSQEFSAWLDEVNLFSHALLQKKSGPRMWQSAIERLLERVDLKELLAAIDFGKLEQRLTYPDLGVDTQPVVFPGFNPGDGIAFYPKLFGLEAGRAIIPHGHRNMVSAHLVLDGKFHLRQYDRVKTENDAWLVRPTVDTRIGPGDASSISDDKDNVHWLVARGERGYTLDIIITGLSGDSPPYEIQNLDPEKATYAGAGLMRFPTLPVGEALKRYGKIHHDQE